MKIEALNEWSNNNYTYNLISDLIILNEVERTTFSKDTIKEVKNIKLRMVNSNRSDKDKTTVKIYYYIKHYLSNFVKYRPDNFDRLLKLVNEEDVILVEHLKMLNG